MFRDNTTLNRLLDESGRDFDEHAANAIQRILPHVQLSPWKQKAWQKTDSVWTDQRRTQIRVTIGIGPADNADSRSLTTFIERRRTPGFAGAAGRVLDQREYEICKFIALRISEVVQDAKPSTSPDSMRAIRDAFDEYIVAQHVERHHRLRLQVSAVFEGLHTLSEQSYENKSLTFGCLLDPNEKNGTGDSLFPRNFLAAKKYKALSDGYRTAYHVSTDGRVLDFVDLERFDPLSAQHYFPDWSEALAQASRSGRCGIALSRQGDILVFDEGTLRFTYRYGRWQYWNHSHLVKLLSDTARAQRVSRAIRGRVVGTIYRAALDVSFRRSGGLFVILRNRQRLRDLVRKGDAIGDEKRATEDREFDAVLRDRKIQGLPRRVIVELASLDGAVVLENSGRILAYAQCYSQGRPGAYEALKGVGRKPPSARQITGLH